MREVIATGKTTEEAIENGCREIGKARDEVSVEILEMPTRKLFKTLPAKVKITVDEPESEQAVQSAPAQKAEEKLQAKKAAPVAAVPQKANAPAVTHVLETEEEVPVDLEKSPGAQAAIEYLNSIFFAMGAQPSISAWQQGDATLLRVDGEELGAILDIKGETVQALSYLTDRAVNKGIDKKNDNYLRVRLDIAGYRNRRETELTALAQKVGAEVARSKRSKTLAPMNSYERLIVHTTISKIEGLVSESIGADTERRVVVKSTAPDATEGEDWRPPRKGGNSNGNRRNDRRGNSQRRDGRGDTRNARGGDRNRDRSGGKPRTSTPDREYASRPRDPDAAPKVPERREAIRDGEDLPLYGKIEL